MPKPAQRLEQLWGHGEMNPSFSGRCRPPHRAHGWRLPLPQTGPAHHLSADISVELGLNPAPSFFPESSGTALPTDSVWAAGAAQVCPLSGYPAVPGNMLFPVEGTSRLP